MAEGAEGEGRGGGVGKGRDGNGEGERREGVEQAGGNEGGEEGVDGG